MHPFKFLYIPSAIQKIVKKTWRPHQLNRLSLITILLYFSIQTITAAPGTKAIVKDTAATAITRIHNQTRYIQKTDSLKLYSATDTLIRYVGRIDFAHPGLARFWNPGIYLSLYFKGSSCKVILQDQVQYGVQHNYIEIVLDGKRKRIRLNHQTDTLTIATELSAGTHHLSICKDTESNIGYISIAGILCQALLPNQDLKNGEKYLIECFGDSITCGASSDLSGVPCGQGRWEDQHNAYMSYGPSLARMLHADWIITAVSGIGLIHSCCGLKITLPEVYDKLALSPDSINWNFQKYQPDLATICLGQNDGLQDMNQFCAAYVDFIQKLRLHYPKTTFVLLTSPMADTALSHFLQSAIVKVEDALKNKGEHNTYHYFFKNRYNGGCDGHPTTQEHQKIATELFVFIQNILRTKIIPS